MVDTNTVIQLSQAAATAAAQANYTAALNTTIVAIMGLLGVIVTTAGTVLLARINVNSKGTKEAATAAVSFSVANGRKVDSLLETTLQIHAMVNKPFGLALESAAIAMETVASMTHEAGHIQAAKTARSVSNEHHASMATYEMAQKVAAALHKTPPATPGVVTDGGDRYVLIVEDDLGLAKLMSEILQEVIPADHVTVVHNAEAALDKMLERRRKIVFVDMRLPGQLQGYDLIVQLDTLYPSTFCVACFTEEDDLKNLPPGLLLGYLKKPISADSLRRMIRSGRLMESENNEQHV